MPLTLSELLIIGSLIFLIYEAYLLLKALRLNAWHNSTSNLLGMDQIAIKNPDLLKCFNEDFDISQITPEQEQFIFSYINCFEQIYVQKDIFNEKHWIPWKNYMDDIMKLPAFAYAWNKTPHKWFIDTFISEYKNKKKASRYNKKRNV